MLSESQKRKGQLSILEKLREGGMPQRSEDMNSMFAQVDEEGKVVPGSEEEEKKKKKKKRAYERGDGETRLPAANQPGAKAFMESFKKVR